MFPKVRGKISDGSGTLVASTDKTVLGAGHYDYIYIQNVDALSTTVIWINFDAAATAANGSIALTQYGSLVFESNAACSSAIHAFSTVSLAKYTVKYISAANN